MSRSMNPKGGDDRVYTPRALALQICQHFKPSGLLLDPCRGEGAFTDALNHHAHNVDWFELDDGMDFLEHACMKGYSWIITNPPWSQFRPFLIKSMEVADNVVFLANLNAWMLKARMRDIKEVEFGFKEALLIDTPSNPWPQSGFQLAAVHIQRGWKGDMKFSRL